MLIKVVQDAGLTAEKKVTHHRRTHTTSLKRSALRAMLLWTRLKRLRVSTFCVCWPSASVGSVGSGRVGSGRVRSGSVGTGRVESGRGWWGSRVGSDSILTKGAWESA